MERGMRKEVGGPGENGSEQVARGAGEKLPRLGGESVGRSRRRDAKLWREAKRHGVWCAVLHHRRWCSSGWTGVGDGIDFYVCEKYKMMDINLLATSPCSLLPPRPFSLYLSIYPSTVSPFFSLSSLSPSLYQLPRLFVPHARAEDGTRSSNTRCTQPRRDHTRPCARYTRT